MSGGTPIRPPATPAKFLRDTNDRLRKLENPTSVRVGPWLLSSKDGRLTATKNGETVVLSDPGAAEVTGSTVRGTVVSILSDVVAGESKPLAEVKADVGNKWFDLDFSKLNLIDLFTQIVSSFQGVGMPIDGSTWDVGAAGASLAGQAATVAALAAQVAKLQNGGGVGVSAIVDFSTMANASSLGADFDQIYSGPGTTATFGVAGGKAVTQWGSVSDSRKCIAIYTPAETTGDNQLIGAAYPTSPETWFFDRSEDARNILIGRINDTGDTYVFVELWDSKMVAGCYVAGVRTVFFTDNGFRFNAGSAYWLRCGTLAGVLVFEMIQGSSVIKTFIDASAVSQYGPGFRKTGMGIRVMSGGVWSIKASDVIAFAMSDAA